jgi:hypothetical protein
MAKTQTGRPSDRTVAARPKRTLQAPHVGPYATMACRDCGAYGCLIPVPHTVAIPGRSLDPQPAKVA